MLDISVFTKGNMGRREYYIVPEAKKEEQEQQFDLSWPGSFATTTMVVANKEKVTDRPLGPKLYVTVVVPIDSLLNVIEHCRLIYFSYIAPL
jgi:hypothetical protein